MSWVLKRCLAGSLARFSCSYAKPGPLSRTCNHGVTREMAQPETPGLASLLVLLPFPSHHLLPTYDHNSPQFTAYNRVYMERYEYPAKFRSASMLSDSEWGQDSAGSRDPAMDFERQFRLLGEDSADSDTQSTSEAEELSHAIPTSESGSGNSDYAERPSILPFPLYDDLPERHIESRSICVPPFEPTPLVPVLFITEEESEIIPLMTSILDQKRVLRHGLPAIGVLYDTHNENCVGEQTTKLYIATADSDDVESGMLGPSSGVYNLRSRLDTLALVHFLILLSEYASNAQSSWSQSITAPPESDSVAMIPTNHYGENQPATTLDSEGSTLGELGSDSQRRISVWRRAVQNTRPSASESALGSESNSTTFFLNPVGDGEGRQTHDHNSVFAWPSTPMYWSFQQRLEGRLDFKHPGMREWSFDHHVITFGLVPSTTSAGFEMFPDIIGSFLYALDVPFECSGPLPFAAVRWQSGVCGERQHGGTHSIHRTMVGVRGIAVLVSEAASSSERLTTELALGSQCKPFWEEIMGWFCNSFTDLNDAQAQNNTACSLHWHSTPRTMKYPRMKELDTVLDAQGALSAADSDEAREQLLLLDWLRRVPHAHLWDVRADWMRLASSALGQYTLTKENKRYLEDEDSENFGELLEALKHSQAANHIIEDRVNPFMEDAKYIEDAALVRDVAGESAARDAIAEITLFRTGSTSKIPQSRQVPSTSPTSDFRTDTAIDGDALHLPVLLFCFQDMGVALKDSTRNRLRLACVSAVRFLAVLGVTDFPVYGLCVCGPYGIPCIAWYSSENKCCYIVDRNTARYRFDLTQEEGVLRYIAFLSKVEERGRELRERFEQAKPSLLEKMRTEEGRAALRWTARAQLDDYQLWPDEVAEDDEEKPRDVMEVIEEYMRAGGLASFKRNSR
ncbi:hypothetical protein C8Q78DRAFT_558015 [Trametes maxima]|nr:hypothetical protein C8Q78DRAFT_558015 [Trametes maxima]